VTFGVGLSLPGVQGQRSPLRIRVNVELVFEFVPDWRTFENVTILQFLPFWAMGKTFLQFLQSFCVQRILARWAGYGDRLRGTLDDGGGIS